MRKTIACVLLVILAGCGAVVDAPPAETESTPTSTPAETDVSVEGGSYPVDAQPVFERVLNLTDQRVPAPTVQIEDPDDASPNILDRSTSQFRSALGVVPPERTNDSGSQLTGYTPSDGETVHIYDGILENETVAESTLAHEYVHTVQFRTDWGSTMWGRQSRDGGEITHDGRLTYYMVLEGSAQYVQHHYEARFLPNAPGSESFGQAAYENASAHARLNLARYVLGGQYVNDTVDSTADLAEIHTDSPVSSEQVLHRNDDPVSELSVDANDVGEWDSEWAQDRQGELFVKIALRTELNRSTATDAAHGWGNDRRITYERGNGTATAWVLRWDDAENATEFEGAFTEYLGAKATQNGSSWEQTNGKATYRLQRVTDRTTVVYLGNESFVRDANATAVADGELTIEAADDSS